MTVLDFTPPSRWVSVFAMDPGMDTGWAWLLFERPLLSADGSVGAVKVGLELSRPMCMSGTLNTSNEVQGAKTLVRYVSRSRERAESFCQRVPRTCIVTESFVNREGTMDPSLSSPERLNSRVQQELSHVDFEYELYEQSPSDAKRVITDKRLRMWGLWHPGQPHRNDAMRHLLLWLRKEANDEHGR